MVRKTTKTPKPSPTGRSTKRQGAKSAVKPVAARAPTKPGGRRGAVKLAPTKRLGRKGVVKSVAARAAPGAKAAGRARVAAPGKKAVADRMRPKPKAPSRAAAPRVKVKAKPSSVRRVEIPKWVEGMRAALEAERVRLMDELQDVGNFSNDRLRGGAPELATSDDDTIDMASQAMERERELALRSNLEDILGRVEKALARIKQGEYGVCERCGEKISRERLKAVPHATMCVRCRAIIDG